MNLNVNLNMLKPCTNIHGGGVMSSCRGKCTFRSFQIFVNFLSGTTAIILTQSGFILGESTVYQLAHLYHVFSNAIAKQKSRGVVFCDMSKAFNGVWHSGLLSKLSKVRITSSPLRWF